MLSLRNSLNLKGVLEKNIHFKSLSSKDCRKYFGMCGRTVAAWPENSLQMGACDRLRREGLGDRN